MKLAKGAVFLFLMIALDSCFNPPEFPIEPEIDFQSIEFKKGGSNADSLILTITFKDGDGDLGIDEDIPFFSSYPYHPINYFLAKDGQLLTISTIKPFEDIPPIFKVDNNQSGKLVSVRTRNEPGYGALPDYNCYAYTFDSVYVQEADKDIFDASYSLWKVIQETPSHPTIYHLLDTFYIEKNTNHFNITVGFEIKNSDGTYDPVDWEEQIPNCESIIFDGRFPVLTESKVPLEGSLRYTMQSSGFLIFFGRTLRLKIQIKDRALHLSNVIYTTDFLIN